VDTVVMDKTGTLTQGKAVVTDVLPTAALSEEELLALAASLESASEHPLAQAIVAKAGAQGLTLQPVSDFTALPGKGLSARLGDRAYLAGNRRLMEEQGVSLPADVGETLAQQGKTPLYFAENGTLLGILAVADVPRPDSAYAVASLKELGLQVVMLTGDNPATAHAIADGLGIDQVIAGVLPTEKEAQIAALQQQGHKVAMVGDGINDAPALTRADVGLAIGGGTDVALESADVVLMGSSLLEAVTAIELSRATIRNIKQDLFWAFCYNCIGIPLAAGVFYPVLGWQLSPIFGAAAMSLSSVSVVTNALRLRFFRPNHVWAEPAPAPAHETPAGAAPDPAASPQTFTLWMEVEGMMCSHCTSRVEQALCALPGVVSATADVAKGSAVAVLSDPALAQDPTPLMEAVSEAGYPVHQTALMNHQNEPVLQQKEVKTMTKVLNVEGMMCNHCKAHVENTLKAVPGVASAEANLEAKTATVELSQPVEDAVLADAVVKAGYEVKSVS
jgi:Cu+-exporting ATPase